MPKDKVVPILSPKEQRTLELRKAQRKRKREVDNAASERLLDRFNEGAARKRASADREALQRQEASGLELRETRRRGERAMSVLNQERAAMVERLPPCPECGEPVFTCKHR